jgi:hypothetical protein
MPQLRIEIVIYVVWPVICLKDGGRQSWSIDGMMISWGKPEYSEEKPASCHFAHMPLHCFYHPFLQRAGKYKKLYGSSV